MTRGFRNVCHLSSAPQQELAPGQEATPDRARFPQYGRYLEDFVPGTVFLYDDRVWTVTWDSDQGFGEILFH